FDSMTVFDNVALGLRRRDLSDDEIADRVREALALVDLTGTDEKLPAELSGGMRKRVGIARAIALRPRYVLYDEPTTGLDPVTSAGPRRCTPLGSGRWGASAPATPWCSAACGWGGSRRSAWRRATGWRRT